MITITIHHVHIAADTSEIISKIDDLIDAIHSEESLQKQADALTEKLKKQTSDLAATVADKQQE